VSRKIVFCFAGRKANLELQLPLIERILADDPDAEFHVWNLTKTPQDDEYVRSISGEGITVRNDFAHLRPHLGFNAVWRHYTDDAYADSLFMKIDDDVIFIETERFGDFMDAVDANRDTVISARVINNGACTDLDADLWKLFQELDIPLLDVHQSPEYARASHDHALNSWPEQIGQPLQLVPTEHWLSINVIGFDHHMVCRIADGLGGPSPSHIAGRLFRKRSKLGDEGSVNIRPRKILQGFLAVHLYFGPQAAELTDDELDDLRKRYAQAGEQYLETTTRGGL
jgi:hypothetical protein